MEPSLVKAFNVKNGELTCAMPFINRYVAGGTTGKSVILFPLDKKDSFIRLVGHRDVITCMDASDDQNLLATGSKDGDVRFWKVTDHDDSCITLVTHHGAIRSISMAPLADQVLILGESSPPSLWDVKSQQLIQNFPDIDKKINTAVMNSHASMIAIGSVDGKCRFYDIRCCDLLNSFDSYSSVLSLSFSTTGESLVAGTANGSIFFCESKNGRILHSSKIHSAAVNSAAIQPNGNLIITASSDNSVILTDTDNFESRFTLSAHEKPVIDAKFSRDGGSFTTCGKDCRVIYWSSPDLTISPEEEEISAADTQTTEVEPKASENSSFSQDSELRNQSQITTKRPKKMKRNCSVHAVRGEGSTRDDAFYRFLVDATSSLNELTVRLGKVAMCARQADERIRAIEANQNNY